MELTRCIPDDSEPRPGEVRRYGVGDVIASKYRLESLLGEGGMGAVWRAFNIQLEAPVAIKVIRGDVDKELTERLRQEARAAAKLGHAAIVRIFDVGESEFGDPFIVMELLSGQSLGAMLGAEHQLSGVRAAQLLLPVVDALSVAHAKGIIHRDLKPDNVFIAVDNGQVQPKLVDFGIVKMSNGANQDWKRITQSGTVIGSPEYMSPEQASGREDLDHRTDIWSLNVVLYEAVVGRVPFKDSNYNALLQSIQVDEPPSQTALASTGGLWRIIQHGLEKDPGQRFQSMTEFGQVLAGWLVSQGISEDACGTSLEAKWLDRTSESHSRRRAPGVYRQGFLTRSRVLMGVLAIGFLSTAAFVVHERSAASAVAPLVVSESALAPPVTAKKTAADAPTPSTPIVSLESLEAFPAPTKSAAAARPTTGRSKRAPAPVPHSAPDATSTSTQNRAARDLISPY